MNLSQQEIEDFEKMNIQFKENGREKEAIDNLYMCVNCMYTYAFCDCDKKIKKLIDYSQQIINLTNDYKWALETKPSKERNEFLKNVSNLIKEYKTQYDNRY